jgi:hypothetical protein
MFLKVIRPSTIAVLTSLLYCLFVMINNDWNPLIWVTLSARNSPPELQSYAYNEGGYDGQFVYLIARDPLDWQYIDVPAYRYQRIVLSAIARVLMFGQVQWLAGVLLAINLVALFIGTYTLERLLVMLRQSPWYALGYGLAFGVWGSVRLTTTETLAYGLAIVGVYLMLKDRWLWAAFLFAVAGLTKETTFLFPLAFGLWMLYQRQWWRAVWFAFIGLTPFLIWQIVLFGTFNRFGIGSGGAFATSFEFIPLGGYFGVIGLEGLPVFLGLSVTTFPFVILPSLWAFWQLWQDTQQGKTWTIYTLMLLVQALLILPAPASTYVDPIAILRYIVGFQIALILYAAKNNHKNLLRYCLLWSTTCAIILLLG